MLLYIFPTDVESIPDVFFSCLTSFGQPLPLLHYFSFKHCPSYVGNIARLKRLQITQSCNADTVWKWSFLFHSGIKLPNSHVWKRRSLNSCLCLVLRENKYIIYFLGLCCCGLLIAITQPDKLHYGNTNHEQALISHWENQDCLVGH